MPDHLRAALRASYSPRRPHFFLHSTSSRAVRPALRGRTRLSPPYRTSGRGSSAARSRGQPTLRRAVRHPPLHVTAFSSSRPTTAVARRYRILRRGRVLRRSSRRWATLCAPPAPRSRLPARIPMRAPPLPPPHPHRFWWAPRSLIPRVARLSRLRIPICRRALSPLAPPARRLPLAPSVVTSLSGDFRVCGTRGSIAR